MVILLLLLLLLWITNDEGVVSPMTVSVFYGQARSGDMVSVGTIFCSVFSSRDCGILTDGPHEQKHRDQK